MEIFENGLSATKKQPSFDAAFLNVSIAIPLEPFKIIFYIQKLLLFNYIILNFIKKMSLKLYSLNIFLVHLKRIQIQNTNNKNPLYKEK